MTCYIVAGGPSLEGFEWDRLKYLDVIAINNAAFRLPYAKHIYFTDLDWGKRFEHELRVCSGQVHQGVSHDYQWIDRPWVRRWNFAESLDDGIAQVSGSGNAALCVAYHLGYRHLTLLGYDFTTGDWYDNPNSNTHEPHQWRLSFNRLIPELKKRGVEVIHPELSSPSYA